MLCVINLKLFVNFNEQILKYLVASDRLCELGYDEAQVEEALEMFQNCESKVTYQIIQKTQKHKHTSKFNLTC